MTVSIAMATYNGEKYLREQLESLAAQTVLPCELVVTDDGSTDRTLVILEGFAASAPFQVRIFSNETRLGYADNFLRACGLCRGDLIALCDQDDVWIKEKIETCLPYFSDDEMFLTVHAGRLLFEPERRLGKKWPQIYEDFAFTKRVGYPLKPKVDLPGFAMIFRREVLSLVDNQSRLENICSPTLEPEKLGHDSWIWFISSSFGKVQTISKDLVWYRQHATNIFGAKDRPGFFGKLQQSIETRNYSRQSRIELEAAQLFERWSMTIDVKHRADCEYWTGYFLWISGLHLLRDSIYDDKTSLILRLFQITRILRQNGYGAYQKSPGLGKKALFKDLTFGLFFAPILKMYRSRNPVRRRNFES